MLPFKIIRNHVSDKYRGLKNEQRREILITFYLLVRHLIAGLWAPRYPPVSKSVYHIMCQMFLIAVMNLLYVQCVRVNQLTPSLTS